MWRHIHPDLLAERARQVDEQQSERDELAERRARHAPARPLRAPREVTFRPSTPMVVLAHAALHATDEADRDEASRGLAVMILDAADARPLLATRMSCGHELMQYADLPDGAGGQTCPICAVDVVIDREP